MQWTDRIRQVKIILVVAAVLIAVTSLVISHFLVRDLYSEERNKMEVWAEAMRSLSMADENTDLNLVLKVIEENKTIPVIVMDRNNEATEFRNIDLNGNNYEDSLVNATKMGRQMMASGKVMMSSSAKAVVAGVDQLMAGSPGAFWVSAAMAITHIMRSAKIFFIAV